MSVNAVQADALAWDWPEARYDLIALIYLHLVEPERRIVHAKALKALKPGGLIVLEAFRPEQVARHAAGARGGPRDPALLYSVEALREDFASEEIVLLEAAEARVDEGQSARRRERGRAGRRAERLRGSGFTTKATRKTRSTFGDVCVLGGEKRRYPTRFTPGGFQVPCPSGRMEGAVVFGQ